MSFLLIFYRWKRLNLFKCLELEVQPIKYFCIRLGENYMRRM